MIKKSIHLLSAVLFAVLILPARAEDAKPAPKGQAETSVEVGGKKIAITFGQPSTDGKGYQGMKAGVPEGFIWRMGSNSATRIETPVDLKFGDVTVKAGAYSLWARKTKDGWNLLFHPKDKRWGYPSPTDGFVAEAPMATAKPKEEVKILTIKLTKVGETGGQMTLEWGDYSGSVKFEVPKP